MKLLMKHNDKQYKELHTLYRTQTQCYLPEYVGLGLQEVSLIFPKCETEQFLDIILS